MKHPFRGINQIFKKAGGAINNVFSKRNLNTFRNHVGDTFREQGKILSTVGKIGTGLALPLALGAAAFMPGALPVILGAGALSGAIGGTGLIEGAVGNLMRPSIYKGKNGLQTTGAVVNQIEKASKGVGAVAKFA